MLPKYKIALVQLYPEPLKSEDNFHKATRFIEEAAAKGAQLVVLPEYHLTGWEPESPQFTEQCAEWRTYLDRYCALARKLHICLVPGTIVELHQDAKTEEEKLINVAYFIDYEGHVLGKYQKKNLWHPERPHLTSSTHERHHSFDTPLGKVGMLICWDLAFNEAFRELIADGAKIIIIPTFWTMTDCTEYGLALNPMSEKVFLESIMTARAYENTCAIIFVNAGGPVGATKPGTWAGLSRVALPFIGAIGEETKESTEEGMSIVEIDMEVLEEAEKNYKVREDIARDDWHYTYRHDSFKDKEAPQAAPQIVRT